MQIGTYKIDRIEFSGSLGDLGTLIPFSTALIVLCGLGVTPVFLMVGLFYIVSGIYFKLPIPVQPLKLVSAIAIAYPEKISIQVIAASGIIFGVILLLLAFSGIIDRLSKFFKKPIVRGIQLGLGFILISKGINFIISHDSFIQNSTALSLTSPYAQLTNPIIGIIGFFITLLLLSSKRFPAAIIIVSAGICIGLISSFTLNNVNVILGPSNVTFVLPELIDFKYALIFLVLPQLPLTIGNAVIGTTETCYSLFGKGEITKKATYKLFAVSMGIANVLTGVIGAMPMCHGAGGLAAHYRFGARTGGSNIMIGFVFLMIAFFFGKIGVSLLSLIPNAVFGVLLIFTGLELALLIIDIKDKNELFIALLIACIGFATTNMAIAFIVGMIVLQILKVKNIKL